jgi:glycerol-3-phosphate acyltransferase PlsY
VFVITFLVFRYVSLASMLSAVAFVLFAFIFKVPNEIKLFSVLLMGFIVLRHKKNIKNILAKKEYKF